MKNSPKNGSKKLAAVPPLFPHVLDPLPQVVLFAGSLAPFGSLLDPFWLPLVPFSLSWDPLLLTVGALGLTFAHPGARFCHLCGLLASFLYIIICSKKRFWCFLMFTENTVVDLFCEITFETLSTKHPKTLPGTLTVAPQRPLRAGAETCRRQLRSALGPKAPRAC